MFARKKEIKPTTVKTTNELYTTSDKILHADLLHYLVSSPSIMDKPSDKIRSFLHQLTNEISASFTIGRALLGPTRLLKESALAEHDILNSNDSFLINKYKEWKARMEKLSAKE